MRRPSPSMLVALAALFIALSSSATAAVLITGKNVKDGSLTGKDIKKRSLTGANIKTGTIGRDQLAASVLSTPQGSVRPGDPGAAGSQGATGPAGANGVGGAAGAKGDKGDPSYRRTIVVSPCTKLATPAENATRSGQALLDVFSGTPANDGCAASGTIPAGAATAASPYLIKLEPGTYSIGDTRLALPSFVDIEGSGSRSSQIVAPAGGIDIRGTSELRFLGVSGMGQLVGLVGLLQGSNAVLDTVAIAASYTSLSPGVLVVGLNIDRAASAVVRDSVISTSTASASSTTVQSVGASPYISRSTISATASEATPTTRAMRLSSGAPVIEDSKITSVAGASAFAVVAASSTAIDLAPINVTIARSDASGFRVLTANATSTPGASISVSGSRLAVTGAGGAAALSSPSGGTIDVAQSRVVGNVDPGTGTLRCFGAYAADLTDRTADCSP